MFHPLQSLIPLAVQNDAKVAISPAEFLMLFLARVGMNPG